MKKIIVECLISSQKTAILEDDKLIKIVKKYQIYIEVLLKK